MTDATSSWKEVADSFAGLGEQLRRHLERVSAEGAPERVAVENAMRDLGTAVERVVDAVGKAVRDPAVREDLTRVGRSLSGALTATFTEAGIRLRGPGGGRSAGRSLPSAPTSGPEAGGPS